MPDRKKAREAKGRGQEPPPKAKVEAGDTAIATVRATSTVTDTSLSPTINNNKNLLKTL